MFAEFPGAGPDRAALRALRRPARAGRGLGRPTRSRRRVKDGRLYGRGAADDKSGIVAHLAALRALDGKPPVHVKVLIEGSEENGRQNAAGGRRRATRS